MGDSAGGNLVCGLINFLILNDMQLPDCIYLLYPGNIKSNEFS